MDQRLEIKTFGGLTIKQDAGNQPVALPLKAKALLVYLVCTDREFPREVVANLLWANGTDCRVMGNLRTLLVSMRHELAPYLMITRETVAFNRSSPHRLDTAELAKGLAAAQDGREPGQLLSPNNLTDLVQVLLLYQGDFLQGFHIRGASRNFEEWLVVERELWRLQVLDALRELVGSALLQEQYALGLTHVVRWLELDPLNETAHRQAMQLYAHNGQWADALHQYKYCQQVLDRELGLPPAAETIDLYKTIKTGHLPHP